MVYGTCLRLAAQPISAQEVSVILIFKKRCLQGLPKLCNLLSYKKRIILTDLYAISVVFKNDF